MRITDFDIIIFVRLDPFSDSRRLQPCVAIELIAPHKGVLAGPARTHSDVPIVPDGGRKDTIQRRHAFAVLFKGVKRTGIERHIQIRTIPFLSIACLYSQAASLKAVGRELYVIGVSEHHKVRN